MKTRQEPLRGRTTTYCHLDDHSLKPMTAMSSLELRDILRNMDAPVSMRLAAERQLRKLRLKQFP
jgi:hypothetical protein